MHHLGFSNILDVIGFKNLIAVKFLQLQSISKIQNNRYFLFYSIKIIHGIVTRKVTSINGNV